jgi:hypothetical protein
MMLFWQACLYKQLSTSVLKLSVSFLLCPWHF